MNYRLENLDGQICVVFSAPLQRKPVMVHSWYPTGIDADHTGYLDGVTVDRGRAQMPGCFTLTWPDGRRKELLLDGGKTLPIKTEIAPIPPPKGHHPVEYRDGCWYKLLKTRGWVA